MPVTCLTDNEADKLKNIMFWGIENRNSEGCLLIGNALTGTLILINVSVGAIQVPPSVSVSPL